ncbi:uncharacterized protein LOC110678017 [Aedes aegypti]|uniref:Uncharacterized protein n=1 Tax=Aedes aegypti TaxID=7159 RepID=A0A6I8U4G6_AEDAE|nr:uncharacterized protein LOC110678017 [Aedes aegypti]
MKLHKLTLLCFQLINVQSNARVITFEQEKRPILSATHNEDEVMMHNYDYPTVMENDEANEVISVRLLNSHRPSSFLPNSAELQNVSYESTQEDPTGKVIPQYNTENVQSMPIESTTISLQTLSTSSHIPLPPDDYSLEKDWIRSRIEIPISSEEDEVASPASLTMPKSRSLTSTTQVTPLTTTLPPSTTPKTPIIFGHRKRKARNYNYYDDLPEVDFDQIDISDLEDSETNRKPFKDIIAQGFKREGDKKSNRSKKRRPKTKPSTTTACPCLDERHQSPVAYDYAFEYDNDDDQYIEHRQRPPVRKRLISQQNGLQQSEDYLMDPTSSIERVERVQSALERIMGIVTIMSHVDSFIHKKTKQSIRRLAKLYESVEE